MTINLDKRSKNGRNTYEWNKKLNSLLEIDFDSTSSNESGRSTFWRFGISIYHQYSYSEILSNVTEQVNRKLYPSELIMDVKFGRSIFIHFKSFHYYFALSMNRNHYHIFLQVHLYRVEWIVMMEDLFKSFHSNLFNTFHYCWWRKTECIITQWHGL